MTDKALHELLIYLNDSFRKYINITLESQAQLKNENDNLRKSVLVLKAEIKTITDRMNDLELALLGDKEKYITLIEDLAHKKKETVINTNDEFLHLNEKYKLPKNKEKNT